MPNIAPARLRASLARMAAALGAPAAPFEEEWRKHFASRMDGTIPDGDGQFLPILQALGLSVDPAQLARATQVRRASILGSLVPKTGTLECLTEFRRRGHKLALATDCSSETPSLLDRTPLGGFFPVRACSSHLRARKPDPAIYLHVLRELGVEGARCLYVGDGNSAELPGAKAHGMMTVWVDNGTEQHWRERHVPEGDYTVRDLRDTLAIAEALWR
ncbi:MAG: HAD family hydrolase [Planctomycetes bacterium]|nr:HAD family hydrolase [Planctomycetota bacterium]